ncbi:MAG: dTDP-4-dehydrorhamnose 3,5-epimerase family protein [Planctomycetota bacterium]|jgi:dTDP-4-dehydrorhamnose 3,5-epimerase
MNIHDVQTVPLTVHEDDRGYLFEVIHGTDPFMVRFGQVYVVGDRVERVVRAYHKHAELHDWFCIIHGAAKFVLVDDRKESPTYRKFDVVTLTEKTPKLLVVPPGIYHGWMSLMPDTMLLSTASHEYNREKPDEERIPPDAFDDLIGTPPWEIEAK